MIPPNEKAIELVENMLLSHEKDYEGGYIEYREAKQCALVATKEMMKEHLFSSTDYSNIRHKYWQEVFIEIKKL